MGKINKSDNRIIRKLRDMPIKKTLILFIITAVLLASLCILLSIIITRPLRNSMLRSNDFFVMVIDIIIYILIFIFPVLFIVGGVYIFYHIKLSIPFRLLMDGTKCIASENLDFTIPYTTKDEMGMLCNSFEKMKEALKSNNIKMWRAAEERKKLNAAFTHDLRTPLTVLRGYTDFLVEYIPSTEKNDEKLLATNQMMAQYITRIEDYVEMMNKIQRLEDTPIQIQTLPMVQFIEMIRDNIEIISKEHQRKFSLINESGCIDIDGDIPLIFRVLENIIQNAFQYSKEEVTLRISQQGKFLCFEVIDDGEGFSVEDLKQALNPFYKSKQADPSHFGLGLSICKTLCENHGGSISISNTKESGAKVYVSFSMKSR